jgi:hypothetical protein
VEERDAAALALELAVLEQAGQAALDELVELARRRGQRDGIPNRKDEDVGLDPRGRRLDDLDLHRRARMVSERLENVPRMGDWGPLRRADEWCAQ